MLSAKQAPGRPRSASSKAAILEATWARMREVGVSRMSIESIASSAGVSKATIYRWWETKGLLALDAYERAFELLDRKVPDTGSLDGDLHALLVPIGGYSAAADPQWIWGQILAEAQYDEALAGCIFARLVAPWRQHLQPIFDRAVARGEIPGDIDRDLLLDSLFGAYYHRLLLHHGAIDQRFFGQVIDMVLRGVLRGASDPGG